MRLLEIYGLKTVAQNLSIKLCPDWFRAKHASLLGVVSVAVLSVFLYLGLSYHAFFLWLVPLVTIVRIFANALDGLLARKHGEASAFGEVLNELIDIGGDSLLFSVFLFVPSVHLPTVSFLLMMIWFAEFSAVLGKALPGGQRRFESLLGGKAERSIWVVGVAIAAAFYPLSGFLNYAITCLALGCFATGVLRLVKAVRVCAPEDYHSFTPFGQ